MWFIILLSSSQKVARHHHAVWLFHATLTLGTARSVGRHSGTGAEKRYVAAENQWNHMDLSEV